MPRPLLDRARRLRGIWDYLPAFRAAAETEHLPTAARALGVSPSALSRSVHLIEDQLQTPVFERSGRRLRLNPAGHELLGAVRRAMRQVDEGLAALSDTPLAGTVTVAAGPEVAAWLIAPALARLRASTPALVGEVVAVPADAGAALRRGDVDVVVTALGSIAAGDEVEVEELVAVRWAVFGAAGSMRGRAFVAAQGEPWPAEHPRTIAALVADSGIAAAMCSRTLVAWLPRPLAGHHRLARIAGQPSAMQIVRMLHRAPVADHPRTDAALAALRAAAGALRPSSLR